MLQRGQPPLCLLFGYVGQELQDGVLLQPGDVVAARGGEPLLLKVLPDDGGLHHKEAVFFLDHQAGEGVRLHQFRQFADVLGMVGHPVEHPALPVQGQLAVQGDETVKGEEVLQKGDHGGDAPCGHKQLDALFPQGLQAPQGRGGYPAAPFRGVVQQGAVDVEKDSFDHKISPVPLL